MPVEEGLRTGDMGSLDEQQPVRVDRLFAEDIADGEVQGIAGDGRGDQQRHRHRPLQDALRRQRPRDEQQRIARQKGRHDDARFHKNDGEQDAVRAGQGGQVGSRCRTPSMKSCSMCDSLCA